MEWRDEGLLLGVRRHGEANAVIQALTAEHGRHAGLVRGGSGAKLAPVLQPGAQLSLEWRARLSDHLGQYRVEPIRSRAGAIIGDASRLAALNALSAMALAVLPEREPLPEFYAATMVLADGLAEDDRLWPGLYAKWELALLAIAGFGLDLRRCAATGLTDDLVYVSPKTGRAVSRMAGGAWADRLLPLPPFLTGTGPVTIGGVREALRLTGFFFEGRVMPALEREEMPAARARLLDRLEDHEIPALPSPPDPKGEEERAYHEKIGTTREGLRVQVSGGISL